MAAARATDRLMDCPTPHTIDDAVALHRSGRLDEAGLTSGEGPLLWQGRLGVMRFARPWTPYFSQWARDLRQLLQNRYRI